MQLIEYDQNIHKGMFKYCLTMTLRCYTLQQLNIQHKYRQFKASTLKSHCKVMISRSAAIFRQLSKKWNMAARPQAFGAQTPYAKRLKSQTLTYINKCSYLSRWITFKVQIPRYWVHQSYLYKNIVIFILYASVYISKSKNGARCRAFVAWGAIPFTIIIQTCTVISPGRTISAKYLNCPLCKSYLMLW